MVPAAGAVGVEVGLRHLAFTQVFAGRRGQFDGAGRADVVGGDRVAEHAEDAGLDDVGDRLRLHAHALEIGRVLNIGGADVPGIGLAAGHLDALPGLVALEDVGVAGGEHLVRHVLALKRGDLFVGRPDVLQIDGLAVLAFAERLGGQVDLHRAGQGVGDHQGRRGQIVGPHVGVHPTFKVAVAREDRAGHQVALLDGLGNGFRQRPGIADAGGAAIAHQVEAERVQRLGQARALQIVGDHLRARRQRGLHPRLDLQALLDGLLGHQAGGDQHAGVGGVGAGRDGGDDHVAMAHIELLAGHGDPLGNRIRLAEVLGQGFVEVRGRAGQQHPVLGPLGAGQGRHDAGEVELEGVGEDRIRLIALAPHALDLGVGFHQGDAVGVAAGGGQIVDGRPGDREEAAGGAVLRGHVGDGRLIFQGHLGQARTEEFDELADHALLAEHLGDGEHQVGGGRALRHGAGQLEADDLGDQHGDRLAEHGGLGLDAAHAPAQDRKAVDHGGVGVGADDGVGIGHCSAVHIVGPDGLGQILQVHLVADAGARGHHAEVVEGRGAPAQEAIALDIALIFPFDVLAEGLGVAEIVDHHRVIDDQVDGVQRIDLFRIGAELGHGVAHGGQVDHGGHAGEVLHQHPGGAEADLVLLGALVVEPRGDGLQVILAHRHAVLVAQQVLQQNLHRNGQVGNSVQAGVFRSGQAVVDVSLVAHRQFAAGLQGVDRRHPKGSSLCSRPFINRPRDRALKGKDTQRPTPRRVRPLGWRRPRLS